MPTSPELILGPMIVRQPYRVQQPLPLLCQLYRYAFDHSSLSTPTVRHDFKTPVRYLTKWLFNSRLTNGTFTKQKKHKTGFYAIKSSRNEVLCPFSVFNTQFHALYFRRFHPCYEPEVCACMDWLLSANSVVYDIGANWGYFTGYIATKPGFTGQIHAFEPQQLPYNDLISLSHSLEHEPATIVPYQLALSDFNGCGHLLYPDELHSGLVQFSTDEPSSSRASVAKARTLDSLSITPPDLIKIDAEMHECHIIRGAIKLISNHHPYLIAELWQHDRALLELLESLNYQAFQLKWRPMSTVSPQYGQLQLLPLTAHNFVLDTHKCNILACPKDRVDFLLGQ